MKKKTIFIIIGIAVALFAVWYFALRKKEQVVVLETEKPKMGYISENVTATGKVQPVDTVAVGTQVSGTIKTLYADFNSKVKKGQLLAELDKTLFEATVNQYQANLVSAQSALVYQQGNFSRQSNLYKVGAVSKADYDNALYTYNASKASVNSIKAQLASAQKNLSLASIYSPIDGTVLSRSVSEGTTVAASFSTPTIFSIAKDLTKMQVEASVDEADVGDISKGERATFTVDAFLNDTFKGTIQEIRLSPSISSNVVTYKTIINTSNDANKLKPGMTANITIFTKEVNNALLIPTKAIKFAPDSTLAGKYQMTWVNPDRKPTGADEAYVWVQKNAKELVQKKIKTGINDNTHVEVLSGLAAADVVITGSRSMGKSQAVAQGQSSPFMPKRPGGNRRR
ncbi:efflux RND transporter periplasmic adaptor subunit [Pedobacter sp. ISL-68]|uniref:efflux RND transporter periplasmic adaptor subunit n=1 Tax=unclassified Pedobacter TaxID=2628915 RepID=UPI001BE61982|nr:MULTISPECIES: efflux RND transporter periplasmic adaptor subunit [unclassified Pedobacter]MBT2562036.1 efflux RND transporter periplasmic adaptor subunit [Pedobacter sp. ISL-64]MBT2591623.1 efflux RND transporter periplasmic adaptor subunit [Pedobacter sp. ISL-68]